jgi:hypothetical protein
MDLTVADRLSSESRLEVGRQSLQYTAETVQESRTLQSEYDPGDGFKNKRYA